MKKIATGLLIAAAVGCIGIAGVGTTSAYFTSYATAKGACQINLGTQVIMSEPLVAEGTKHMEISNGKDSREVYVRARAFAGSSVDISYSGSYWKDGGDGYYYYSDENGLKILAGGETTDGDKQLLVHFEYNNTNVEIGTEYYVTVSYESTPVQYDIDGKPYADWSIKTVVEGDTE